MLKRIVVGKPRTETIPPENRIIDPEVYRQCETAVVESNQLEISYVDKSGNETTRVVDPHGMMIQTPLWYLLVHDHKRDAPRFFRLDRIKHTKVDPLTTFLARDPREIFTEIQVYSLEMNPN